MRNDAPKPLRIVLLDSAGKPIVGPGCTWETCDHGKAGFRVTGRLTSLRWDQEGVTWKLSEEK